LFSGLRRGKPRLYSSFSGGEALRCLDLSENALILRWECRRCRGPFDFAQGRLFDYVAASLREAATPLRMTFL
jgi:hypothetical protein